MKKSLSLILAMLMTVAVAMSSCANQNADSTADSTAESSADTGKYVSQYQMIYPERSIDEVVERSVLVVRAKHKHTLQAEKRDSIVYTDRVFEVEEVFFGDKSVGDEITVQFIGGTIDGHEHIYEDAIEIPDGSEVIMILNYPKDGNEEVITTERYSFYPPKGVLVITDGKSDDGYAYFEASDPSAKYTAYEMKDIVARVKG